MSDLFVYECGECEMSWDAWDDPEEVDDQCPFCESSDVSVIGGADV